MCSVFDDIIELDADRLAEGHADEFSEACHRCLKVVYQDTNMVERGRGHALTVVAGIVACPRTVW
jgi:hypothetical protein